MNDHLAPASGDLPLGWSPGEIITDRAHPARMYDYLLGGRDNYQIDRDTAETALAGFPQLREVVRANRAFHQRAVRTLVAEHGIRQIIDIGAGFPLAPNTHEIAHQVAPDTRVLYIDNDPIVLTHARGRLADHTPLVAILEADLRAPDDLLSLSALRQLLDLNQPVGLLLVSVLHFLPESDRPHQIVTRLMDALAPGSALVLSHATAHGESEKATEAAATYDQTQTPITLRSPRDIAAFFDALDLLEPGVVKQPWWRPDRPVDADPALNWGYAAIGIKTSRPPAHGTKPRTGRDL